MRKTYKNTLATLVAAGLLLGPMAVFAAPGGPTVTIASSALFTPATPTNITWQDPIPFSVTISSSTSDFDASDIQVVGGSIENFAGSGGSYTFKVNPGDGDPLHDSQARYVQVQINENQFSDNQPSNSVSFWFDPAAAPVDNTAPAITFIDPSPADGSTVYTASDTASTTGFTFAFTIDDASSTVMCSIVDSTGTDSFYTCGSPQTFSGFGIGSYRFALKATDTAGNAATSSRAFTIATGSSTLAAPTPAAPAPAATPSGGGGGSSNGNGMIVGSSPTAPGGSGSGSAGGFFNPNPIIPTLPTAASPSPSGAPQPTVSRTSAPAAAPARTVARAAPSAQAGAPLALAAQSSASASTAQTDATVSPVPSNQELGAAAATAGGVPASVWIWSVLAIALIAFVGWLLFRPA